MRTPKLFRRLSNLVVTFLFLFEILSAKTIYVDLNATGNETGDSWGNAYTSLLNALNSANNGDELWVSKGIYKPTTSSIRYYKFAVPSGVSLFGGFEGTETALSQRDWESNLTVLSGEVGSESKEDNTTNVVTISRGTDITILDGFTIQDAYKKTDDTSTGAGIFVDGSEAIIKNCIIKGNIGGGLFCSGGKQKITNCEFRDNIAPYGAAINSGGFTFNGLIIQGCIFENNKALSNSIRSGMGGAIAVNQRGDSVVITNCTFKNNHADNSGGAIRCQSRIHTEISNCGFQNNRADYRGGAISIESSDYEADIILINTCSFDSNSAESGGAIAAELPIRRDNHYFKIDNCQFRHNIADEPYWAAGGALMVMGGGGLLDGRASLYNNIFEGNEAISANSVGGAIYLKNSNLSICKSHLYGNSAGKGGAIASYNSAPVVSHCRISGNTGGFRGGAICFDKNEEYNLGYLINSVFSGNAGWAIDIRTNIQLEIRFCTIAGNTGGISLIGGSTTAITSSIIWGNGAGEEPDQVADPVEGRLTLNYSVLQGLSGFHPGIRYGERNSGDNPLFENLIPSSNVPTIGGNYRLTEGSKAIDSATSYLTDIGDVDRDGFTNDQVEIDLDGGSRLKDGDGDGIKWMDIGPYEYGDEPEIDNEPPVSTITDPVDGQTIGGTSYTIRGTADDNSGYISKVQVSVDGGSIWHTAQPTSENYATWQWVWSGFGQGSYRIKSRAADGVNWEVPNNGITVNVATQVELKEEDSIPIKFRLSPNYPNPFNPSTTVQFQVPYPANVEINIYNLEGQKIKTLIDDHLAAGYHTVIWNATNDSGLRVSSGVYILQMKSDKFNKNIKLSLLR